MKVTQLMLVFLACATLTGVAAAGAENAAGLFELGLSARAFGVGGAFTALADDESSVLHNPAALGTLRGMGFTSLFVRQFGGVSYGAVGVATSYVGLAAVFVDSGWIESGASGFRYASQGIVASAGVPVGPVSFGARWRFYRASSPASGSGWSFDPAALLDFDVVRVGVVYEGAFTQGIVYAGGGEESWDQQVRVGLVVRLSPSEDVVWSVTADGIDLLGLSPRLAAGIEAWIGGFGARMGFDGIGPTFGVSLRFDGLELDWAYAIRADLGDSHRVSLSLRF